MTNNKINIGVIGTGKLGTYHIQKLQMILTCNLVGIYDLDNYYEENNKLIRLVSILF